MTPEIENLIEFTEDIKSNSIPSKTYKLNIDDNMLYIDEYLENITFEIENGNLIEKIKDISEPIYFSLENGDLIIFSD